MLFCAIACWTATTGQALFPIKESQGFVETKRVNVTSADRAAEGLSVPPSLPHHMWFVQWKVR